MEIRYLQEFTALAEIMNYSETAAELHMTQAGLSRHIQALERELGESLFDRSTRSISLSAFGRWYLPYASSVVKAWTDSEAARREYQEDSMNRAVLGSIRIPQMFHVEEHVRAFRAVHPECRLQIVEGDENELFRMYHRNQIDLFCAFFRTGEYGNYRFLPMYRNNIVVVYPRGHEFENKPHIEMEWLNGRDILLPTRKSQSNEMIRDALSNAGITTHIVYEGTSSANSAMIKDGLGIAVMPSEFTESLPACDFSWAVLKPEISYTYGIVYRDVKNLSAGARKLLDYVKGISESKGL